MPPLSSVREIDEAEALGLIDEVSDEAEARLKEAWFVARDELAETAEEGEASRAMEAGVAASALAAFNWRRFEDNLREALEQQLWSVVDTTTEVTTEMLGVERTPILDASNRMWAEQEAERRVKEESGAAQTGLLVAAALAIRLGADLSGRDLTEIAGIQQQWSGSYVRTHIAMEGDPRRAREAAKLSRARSLHGSMASAFGKSAARTAGVVGISETASAAATAGLIPQSEWVMEWVTRPFGACPICIALDGQTVEIGLPFYHPEVGRIFGLAHLHCQCSRRVIPRKNLERAA